MADVVREVRPDVIITHNDEDYMQDHIETSRIAFNGSFISSLAHKSVKYAAYDKFVPIYFMDTLAGVNFIPTHYVDISKQIDRKLEALAKHESQIKWMLEHDRAAVRAGLVAARNEGRLTQSAFVRWVQILEGL